MKVIASLTLSGTDSRSLALADGRITVVKPALCAPSTLKRNWGKKVVRWIFHLVPNSSNRKHKAVQRNLTSHCLRWMRIMWKEQLWLTRSVRTRRPVRRLTRVVAIVTPALGPSLASNSILEAHHNEWGEIKKVLKRKLTLVVCLWLLPSRQPLQENEDGCHCQSQYYFPAAPAAWRGS